MSQVLNGKSEALSGASGLKTTRAGLPLVEAAAIMLANKIGCLVVIGDGADDEGRLVGIISERDLSHALAQFGADAAAERVSDVMTHAVTTCTLHMRVDDVLNLMTAGKFRHVPIVDGHRRVVGLISIGDVVKAALAERVGEVESLMAYVAGGG